MDAEDVITRLARIETKLDTHLENAKDHEVRIRVLERWRWKSTGALVVLAAAWEYVKAKLHG